jgi:hypothetical protein
MIDGGADRFFFSDANNRLSSRWHACCLRHSFGNALDAGNS